MEEWADRTSTCLGCTPGFPSAPHTPCGGTGAMPGMPSRPRGAGRAHLQSRLLFGAFVAACDRGDDRLKEFLTKVQPLCGDGSRRQGASLLPRVLYGWHGRRAGLCVGSPGTGLSRLPCTLP